MTISVSAKFLLRLITVTLMSQLGMASLVLAETQIFNYSLLTIPSDVKFWVCNAGINTVSASTTYYHSITRASMTAGQCVSTPHHCITVNPTNQYKKNFMVASYGVWNGVSASTTTRVTSADNSTAGTSGVLFNITSGDVAWTSKLYTLNFYFASPDKTSQFFVDLCFRGEVGTYTHQGNGNGGSNGNGNNSGNGNDNTCNGNVDNGNGNTNGNCRHKLWTFTNSATTVSLSGQGSYVDEADVQVTSYLACDLQEEGAQQGGTVTNVWTRDLTETNISNGFTADKLWSSSFYFLSPASTQTFFNSFLLVNNLNAPRTPRFCKLRHYFVETSGLRDQSKAATQFTINATVTEDPPP